MKTFTFKYIVAFALMLCSISYINAQVTITASVTSVSVDFGNNNCDLDNWPNGDSDPEWDLNLSDNREYNESFRHEITTNNDATVTGGYDNSLTYSRTYNGICPPNFLIADWSAYEDDGIGSNANCGATTNIPIIDFSTGNLISGTNAYALSCNVSDCSGTTWTINLSVTVTGTPDYICSDNPCTSDIQVLQDGCAATPQIFTYDVSNSTSDLSSGSTTCGVDGNNDIFFQFVAPPSGEFVMDMTDFGDFGALTLTDLTINLYEGSCSSPSIVDSETYYDNGDSSSGNVASAQCVDLSGGLGNSSNTPFYFQDLTPGQTYFIRMTEQEDQNASADLSFQAIVENNGCDGAISLTSTDGTFDGCNYNANDNDEPDETGWTGGAHTGSFNGFPVQTCTGWSSNENMVWYSFEVTDDTPRPVDLTVENVACNSAGGATAQVGIWYAGSTPCAVNGNATATNGLGAMTGVGCAVGTDMDVTVTVPNPSNGTYYAVVDGTAGAQCTWRFTSAQILPVELASFIGFAKDEVNVLTWSTVTEENNKLFEVQRSTDPSQQEFEVIGVVEGNGNSAEMIHYEFTDEKPATTSYYRLKQVDFDGSYTFTNVVKVIRKTRFFAITKIGPNPTAGLVNLELEIEDNSEDVQLSITDMTGKVMLSRPVNGSEGLNSIQLDMTSYASGIYNLTIQSNNHRIVEKILKR